ASLPAVDPKPHVRFSGSTFLLRLKPRSGGAFFCASYVARSSCRMAMCRAAILAGPNVHSIKSRHPRLTSGSALVLPTGVRTWAVCYRCATAAYKNTVEADLVHARRMTWRRNPGIFAVGAWVGEFLDEAVFAPRQRLRSRARAKIVRVPWIARPRRAPVRHGARRRRPLRVAGRPAGLCR